MMDVVARNCVNKKLVLSNRGWNIFGPGMSSGSTKPLTNRGLKTCKKDVPCSMWQLKSGTGPPSIRVHTHKKVPSHLVDNVWRKLNLLRAASQLTHVYGNLSMLCLSSDPSRLLTELLCFAISSYQQAQLVKLIVFSDVITIPQDVYLPVRDAWHGPIAIAKHTADTIPLSNLW